VTARRPIALITGISGQDGSYLAELLLEKGYEVHGTVRRDPLEDEENRLRRIGPIKDRLSLHANSIESFPSIFRLFSEIQPTECYHLAAHSFVGYSFEDEFSTMNANINGTHYMLASIHQAAPRCRFYFAGSSEMIGKADVSPQNEQTRFHPRSVYGISKVAGYELTRNYRETYGLHASAGILYNHESPRRGYEFVSRKITSHAAKIKLGLAQKLFLGDLEARRDWGDAREYVKAIWAMLQQPAPDDYVIATGKVHTVRDLLNVAFSHVGLNYKDYVVHDPKLVRPSEAVPLCGDASKARRKLGWTYNTTFENLIRRMVEWDLKRLSTLSAPFQVSETYAEEPT